jgi:hypothetical protein
MKRFTPAVSVNLDGSLELMRQSDRGTLANLGS